jgi:hypothetical protein
MRMPRIERSSPGANRPRNADFDTSLAHYGRPYIPLGFLAGDRISGEEVLAALTVPAHNEPRFGGISIVLERELVENT